VDAGTGRDEHVSALDEALAGARLAAVVVTHNHSDHASGAVALAGRDPALAFAKLAWPERDQRYAVPWRALADGDLVEAGDTALEVVHTPGHAPDHICLWHEESRTLFSGDLVLAHTTVVVPASAQGDMADYLASLERVLASLLGLTPAECAATGCAQPPLRVSSAPAQLLRDDASASPQSIARGTAQATGTNVAASNAMAHPAVATLGLPVDFAAPAVTNNFAAPAAATLPRPAAAGSVASVDSPDSQSPLAHRPHRITNVESLDQY